MLSGHSDTSSTTFGIHACFALCGLDWHAFCCRGIWAAALNKSQVVHSAVGVLYTLVQEEVVGSEQASKMLLADLQGLRHCSACLEPPIDDSSCDQAVDAGQHCRLLRNSCMHLQH